MTAVGKTGQDHTMPVGRHGWMDPAGRGRWRSQLFSPTADERVFHAHGTSRTVSAQPPL